MTSTKSQQQKAKCLNFKSHNVPSGLASWWMKLKGLIWKRCLSYLFRMQI